MSLEALVYESTINRQDGLLVLLHGWGANANDLMALAPLLRLSNYQIWCPNAPFFHPYNPVGRIWYSLPEQYGFASTDPISSMAELQTSRQLLREWILSLSAQTGIPLSQTIIGGFSQGGAMTLDVGRSLPLRGLMVLSGYLHTVPEPQTTPYPPTLMVHGCFDPIVPLAVARQAREHMTQLGMSILYHEYEMGHEIGPEVLDQMRRFILDDLDPSSEPNI